MSVGKFEIRQDGKICNKKTGWVAWQPVLWIKKTFGGKRSNENFHEFMNLKYQIEKKAAGAPSTQQNSMLLALSTNGAYEVLKNKMFPDANFPEEYVKGLTTAQVNELKNDYPIFAKQYIEQKDTLYPTLPAIELLVALGEIRVQEKISSYGGSLGTTKLEWNYVHVQYLLVSDGSAAKRLNDLLETCCAAKNGYRNKNADILREEAIGLLESKPDLQNYAKVLFENYPLYNGYSHSFKEISESPALMEKMRKLGMDVSDLTRVAEQNLSLVLAAGM